MKLAGAKHHDDCKPLVKSTILSLILWLVRYIEAECPDAADGTLETGLTFTADDMRLAKAKKIC